MKRKMLNVLFSLIATSAIGQINTELLASFKLNPVNIAAFNNRSNTFVNLNLLTQPICKNSLPIADRKVLPPIEPFKYEAFFCRIEQQMCNRLDVWIKVRVGDESNYHRNKAIE